MSTFRTNDQEAQGGAAAPGSELFRGLMGNGESVLWAGQPGPFRIARSKAAHALFGSVILILFTMTPMRAVLQAPPRAALEESGISRVLVMGSVLMLAAYGLLVPLVAYRRAWQTWYVVTDRRVLRVRSGDLDAWIHLDDLESTALRPLDDGTGDIQLGCHPSRDDLSTHHLRDMVGIGSADEVRKIINDARTEHARKKRVGVQDYLEFLLQGKRSSDLS